MNKDGMKPTQQDYLETEEYKFLRLCSIDFEQAKNSLNLIEGVEVESIRFALVRDALISYARPFTSNRGKYKFGHKLSKNDYISGEHIGLHLQILAVRDQVVAHSDVEMKAGGIQLVGGNFLFSFRSFSDFYKLHAKTRLPFLRLIESVEEKIKSTIHGLETSEIERRNRQG